MLSLFSSKHHGSGFSLRPIFSGMVFGLLALGMLVCSAPVCAQDALMRPGEAYATRFSGIVTQGGATLIDINGTVGGVFDIRNPGHTPQGRHWTNAPQRLPVTAGAVGQMFGIALDAQSPPNIYLTATSAFGLHRIADISGWMTGLWGPGAGPGAI